jgi:hypothetical protein
MKDEYKEIVDGIFEDSRVELENLKKLNEKTEEMIEKNEKGENIEGINLDDLMFKMEKNLSLIEERSCHARNEFYSIISRKKNKFELADRFEDCLGKKLKEYGLESEEEE